MSIFKRKRKSSAGKTLSGAAYTIALVDHLGVKRRLPAFRDKAASAEFDRNIRRLVDIRRAGGIPDASAMHFLESCPSNVRDSLAAWGIIDPEIASAGKPLAFHIDKWQQWLRSKQRSESYCKEAPAGVRLAFSGCGFMFWTNIRAERFERWLADKRASGASNRTSNAYLAKAKAFCSWMVESGFVSKNPLDRISILNEDVDKRRQRRAFSPEEMRRLLDVAASGPRRFGLSGNARALLYRLAAETGLRWSELRSLRKSSFDFSGEVAVVVIEAADAKNKHDDFLPLRPEMTADMRLHLDPLENGDPAFPGMWMGKGSEMIERDMEAADIPYIDDCGRYADFHALRHTFISNLCRAGVHPKIAQDLARHSNIQLTMKTYTHTVLESRMEALGKLPDIVDTRIDTSRVSNGGQSRPMATNKTNANRGSRDSNNVNEPHEIKRVAVS